MQEKEQALIDLYSMKDNQAMIDKTTEPNERLAALIAKAIKESGKTKKVVAIKCGVKPQAATGWTSTGRISKDTLAKLAVAVGKPLSYFLPDDAGNVTFGPEIRGKLPLINWVKAGDLCESHESIHPGDAEEWIDCPVPHSNRAYCLRVSGDSMDGEGGYRDGEIIFVDPEVAATPGRDVVVRTEDGKTTFKRLKQDTEGFYLFGINGKKIIRIPPDTHICGVVIFSGFKR